MGFGGKVQAHGEFRLSSDTEAGKHRAPLLLDPRSSPYDSLPIGGTPMVEPKLEVPAELRELAEKTIDQAERAFRLFFDAAQKSSATAPTPAAELSKQVLAFWEESLKTSFEHARKLALTSSLKGAANVQAELVKRQMRSAEQHLRRLAAVTGSKDQT